MKHKKYLIDQKVLTNDPEAKLPDNTKIRVPRQGTLPLHQVLLTAAFIYPCLQNESLLSIGQLCDEGCIIAIFNKTNLSVLKENKVTLKGTKNLTDELWDVQVKRKSIQVINYTISRDKIKTELAKYLHGCAFSRVILTFQQCINKRNSISWPSIYGLNFKRVIETTEATIKRYLDQEQKNM